MKVIRYGLLHYTDNDGNLWFTPSKKGLFLIPSKEIELLLENKQNTIKYAISAEKLTGIDDEQFILAVFRDSKKRLWISNWGNVFQVIFSKNISEIQTENELKQASNSVGVLKEVNNNIPDFNYSQIANFEEDNTGKIWMGTSDNGIKIYDVISKQFVSITEDNDLVNNTITGITKDSKNRMWVATNAGISLMDNKGLFPSNQISPYSQPKLFDAAKTTLIHRGDVSTGWSMGWKVNFWARLLDGNHALKLITDQLTLVDPVAGSTGGTYPANDYLYVNFDKKSGKKVSYKILDISGRKISNGILSLENTIKLKDYMSGVYMLQLQDNEQIITKKFTIKR